VPLLVRPHWGSAGRRADVGIPRTGSAIGDLNAAPSGRRLDATGSVVAPGFVDIHTHSELPLLADGRAESTIRQGVTTQATGNCGLTPAPVHDAVREQIKGTMIGPAHGSWRGTFGGPSGSGGPWPRTSLRWSATARFGLCHGPRTGSQPRRTGQHARICRGSWRPAFGMSRADLSAGVCEAAG
jgi:hypothetical protein